MFKLRENVRRKNNAKLKNSVSRYMRKKSSSEKSASRIPKKKKKSVKKLREKKLDRNKKSFEREHNKTCTRWTDYLAGRIDNRSETLLSSELNKVLVFRQLRAESAATNVTAVSERYIVRFSDNGAYCW